MPTPIARWKGLDRNDRMFFVGSVLAPLAVWFIYKSHKYSTKGMR